MSTAGVRQTRRWWLWAFLILLSVAGWYLCSRENRPTPTTKVASAPPTKTRQQIVINEAVRTLLYLPLYHAKEAGYFDQAGIDVQIVTAGTATNSFAALVNGEAQFSQADPMYVPIAREKGGKAKVVAQVVGRIAIYGLAAKGVAPVWSAAAVRGKKISTQQRPMTAYVYTIKAIRELRLDPDKDVTIIESQPGSETSPLFNGQAAYAFTVEPNASRAVQQGAAIVVSFPQVMGDTILTGLMTTEDYLTSHRPTVEAVVMAYQRALNDIHVAPEHVALSASKYFSQVDRAVLSAAIARLARDQVFPTSVLVSEESWNRAMKQRLSAGDLKYEAPRKSNCDIELMTRASAAK